MNSLYQNFQAIIKSIVDYSVSLLSLILLSPLILVLTLVIKISGKGPVVHSQKRIGKSGNSFVMYKFRSMYLDTEENVPLLSGKNDKRITPVGRFMRKHKFDEIPNFINVLKGEMSLLVRDRNNSFSSIRSF